MKIGDLIVYEDTWDKWFGIVLGIEKDYKYSRSSKQKTRKITEVITHMPDGTVKWLYSEKVRLVNESR